MSDSGLPVSRYCKGTSSLLWPLRAGSAAGARVAWAKRDSAGSHPASLCLQRPFLRRCSMGLTLRRALIAVFTVAIISPVLVHAQPTIKRETAQRISSLEGPDTYREYCAVCHGTDAKGRGPAAPALKPPPSDLTTYARRHGGAFSAVDLRQIIEGQDKLSAHGSREMPIWGNVFRAFDQDSGIRDLRLKNLISYLESLQVK